MISVFKVFVAKLVGSNKSAHSEVTEPGWEMCLYSAEMRFI